ncbi:MAG: diaminopimelate decarboxylase [Gemmatimonadales bacterium]
MELITRKEICSAWREAVSRELIASDDTSVIFVNFSIIQDRVRRLREAFPEDTLHAVAIKTNPLAAVLKFLNELDVGFEAASLPEVRLARNAGLINERIILDSPAKTRSEIQMLMREYPGMRVNADSLAELHRYPAVGSGLRLGIRINPLVVSDTVGYMNVGGSKSKFGEPISNRGRIIEACLARNDIECLHIHIGSQFVDAGPTIQAVGAVLELAEEVNARSAQQRIRCLNLGGGFPVNFFPDSSPFRIEDYASALRDSCPRLFDGTYQLITEYGRYVHANACWAVSDVEYVKPAGDQVNLIVHLGADMFLRECYNPGDWHHEMFLIDGQGIEKNGKTITTSVAGPLCFGGDFVRISFSLPPAEPGDRLVIQDVGANTFSLWSRHCSRPFPKVISYESPPGSSGPVKMRVARPREDIDSIVNFWNGGP